MQRVAVEYLGTFPVYQAADRRKSLQDFYDFICKRKGPALFADLSDMSEDGIWELHLTDGTLKKLRLVSHHFLTAFFEIANDNQEVVNGQDSDIYFLYPLIAVAS